MAVFKWEAKVRDYELDFQGIVNNAIYLNYFEQSRNEYVRSLNIDVMEYAKAGYHFVVAEVEVQYRAPLRMNDEFYVTAKISHYNKRRFYFEQELCRKHDDKVLARAKVTGACMDHQTGRAVIPERLEKKIIEVIKK